MYHVSVYHVRTCTSCCCPFSNQVLHFKEPTPQVQSSYVHSVTRRQGLKLPFLTAALPICIFYVLRELHIFQSDLCSVSIQGHLHL